MNSFNNKLFNAISDSEIRTILEDSNSWADKNGKKWEDYDKIICPDGTIINMKRLLRDQNIARNAIMRNFMWFGPYIAELKIVYTFRVQTQATDGTHLLVNPQFTYRLTLKEKIFVMCHELMHCVLNHLQRGRGHDPQKSNIAADYEVNITLTDLNVISIAEINKIGALIDEKYRKQGYEKIYMQVSGSSQDNMSNQQNNTNTPQNQNNSNSGNNTTSSQNNSNPQDGNSNSGNNTTPSQNNSNPQDGNSNPGNNTTPSQNNSNPQDGNSNSGNGPTVYRTQKNSNPQDGNSNSGNGPTVYRTQNTRTSKDDPNTGIVRKEDCADESGELKKIPGNAGGMISSNTGNIIAKAEGETDSVNNSDSQTDKYWEKRSRDVANKIAKTPGAQQGYKEIAAEILGRLRPSKNWKKELRQIVGTCISNDSTRRGYLNKNRYVIANQISMTSKFNPNVVDCIMCWIDTSGSMTQEIMNQALMDVYGIASQKKPINLFVIQFDTEIQDIQLFTSPEQFKRNIPHLKIKGGGGTDYECCFKLLKEKKNGIDFRRLNPELVICFTDGYLEQQKRPITRIRHFVYAILDNPTFSIKYKDSQTRAIYIDTKH